MKIPIKTRSFEDKKMKRALIDKLIQNSQPVLKKYPEILSAYLFGSVSMELQKKDSDVDIAVRLIDTLLPEKSLDIRFRLLDEFESCFDKQADVVVLNTESLKMIHQVFSNDVLIYPIDPNAEMDFTVKKQKEYFDFQYYIQNDGDAQKDKLYAVKSSGISFRLRSTCYKNRFECVKWYA